MFSVEIKLNGSMIAHIYGRNITQYSAYDNLKNLDESEYIFEYYEPEIGELIKGNVSHKRSDGIVPLIIKILKNASKKLKKSKTSK